jgi:hypothetical protein
MSVYTISTQRHIPEDGILHQLQLFSTVKTKSSYRFCAAVCYFTFNTDMTSYVHTANILVVLMVGDYMYEGEDGIQCYNSHTSFNEN